jgi:hypothetical protein
MSGPSARAIFRIVFASGTSPASIRVKARYYGSFSQSIHAITAAEYNSVTAPEKVCMSGPVKYWDRFHSNHSLATVELVSGRYAATVTRDGSGGHTPQWADTLKEALARADDDATRIATARARLGGLTLAPHRLAIGA